MFELIKKKDPLQDVRSFCEDNKIKSASYYYWLKKFRDQQIADSVHGFIPVKVPPSSTSPLASIELKSGTVINIFDAEVFSLIQSFL